MNKNSFRRLASQVKASIELHVNILWRDSLDVPSECTIVKAVE
jgi:hypothetical protein